MQPLTCRNRQVSRRPETTVGDEGRIAVPNADAHKMLKPTNLYNVCWMPSVCYVL